MLKLALVAGLDVKPTRRRDFIAWVKHHAVTSLETQPGCKQFDVLTRDSEETSVFLYELYSNDTALEAQMNSPHLASTRGSYHDVITSKRVTRCARV